MNINNLIEELSLEVLNLDDGSREISGGYCGDLLSWVMGRAKSGDAWVTIMTNINIIAVASLADTACIILAEHVEIDNAVKEKASAQGINLFRSVLSSFELCSRISDLISRQ